MPQYTQPSAPPIVVMPSDNTGGLNTPQGIVLGVTQPTPTMGSPMMGQPAPGVVQAQPVPMMGQPAPGVAQAQPVPMHMQRAQFATQLPFQQQQQAYHSGHGIEMVTAGLGSVGQGGGAFKTNDRGNAIERGPTMFATVVGAGTCVCVLI